LFRLRCCSHFEVRPCLERVQPRRIQHERAVVFLPVRQGLAGRADDREQIRGNPRPRIRLGIDERLSSHRGSGDARGGVLVGAGCHVRVDRRSVGGPLLVRIEAGKLHPPSVGDRLLRERLDAANERCFELPAMRAVLRVRKGKQLDCTACVSGDELRIGLAVGGGKVQLGSLGPGSVAAIVLERCRGKPEALGNERR
jgi:hypothetical protein